VIARSIAWQLYGALHQFDAGAKEASKMSDFLTDIVLVILGTGGVMLMAGYAWLCERI
jgi:hypothetical protein